MNPADFIRLIAPAAQASADKTGIPASFTIAQAALESGWGSSLLATEAKNLFGVKADKSWTGDVWLHNTREFLHGKWVVVEAKWRKYADWQGCMDDHAEFLTSNPRYKAAFDCGRGDDFCRAIAKAGYATDPTYAEKIISIIHGRNLQILDTPHGRIA